MPPGQHRSGGFQPPRQASSGWKPPLRQPRESPELLQLTTNGLSLPGWQVWIRRNNGTQRHGSSPRTLGERGLSTSKAPFSSCCSAIVITFVRSWPRQMYLVLATCIARPLVRGLWTWGSAALHPRLSHAAATRLCSSFTRLVYNNATKLPTLVQIYGLGETAMTITTDL